MADHKNAGILAGTLLLAREVAHREHLKVQGPGSYAKHMALGDFYNAIGDLADTFVEGYQGCFDCILDVPLVANNSGAPIIEVLRSQQKWIRVTRYTAVPKDETPLQNLIDEVEMLYFRTIYKLRRLS